MKWLFAVDGVYGLIESMKRLHSKGDSQVTKTKLYIIADRTMNNVPFGFIVIQCFVLAHTR